VSRRFVLRIGNVSETSYRESQNTHILSSEEYYTVRHATDDIIMRRMRISCWTLKATDTHCEYVILIAFSLQQ